MQSKKNASYIKMIEEYIDKRHLESGAFFSFLGSNKKQRKSLNSVLRPFLCSLSLSCPPVPRKQLLYLHGFYFPGYFRCGDISDQTLFADQHFSADHRTEDVASCHIAIERSHRQAGQLCRQLARQGIGIFVPAFCY